MSGRVMGVSKYPWLICCTLHLIHKLLGPLAEIKVFGVLSTHWPLILDVGTVSEYTPQLICAGFVYCHCTGRWAVFDNIQWKEQCILLRSVVQPLPWPLLLLNRSAWDFFLLSALTLKWSPKTWELKIQLWRLFRCINQFLKSFHQSNTCTTLCCALTGPYYDGDKLGVVCDYKYSLQGVDILECDTRTQPGELGTE